MALAALDAVGRPAAGGLVRGERPVRARGLRRRDAGARPGDQADRHEQSDCRPRETRSPPTRSTDFDASCLEHDPCSSIRRTAPAHRVAACAAVYTTNPAVAHFRPAPGRGIDGRQAPGPHHEPTEHRGRPRRRAPLRRRAVRRVAAAVAARHRGSPSAASSIARIARSRSGRIARRHGGKRSRAGSVSRTPARPGPTRSVRPPTCCGSAGPPSGPRGEWRAARRRAGAETPRAAGAARRRARRAGR